MTEKIKTVDYEQPIQDESELSAEIEDSSERSQKIGQETVKSHERLVSEEPIPEMSMIKAGRMENKAQACMDFARLKHLKNKLESGEAFTAEELTFIYEKDRPIERAESADGTAVIANLRGNVRKMLENGTKLEDIVSILSLSERVSNINALVDHGLKQNEAVVLAENMHLVRRGQEPYEQISLAPFVKRGMNIYYSGCDMLPQISQEDIIKYYDILTGGDNGPYSKWAYTPDDIIRQLSADTMIKHIDFIRKIKPDFDPNIILQRNRDDFFSHDKIGPLINCGIKPEDLWDCIDFEGIAPEQLKMLLPDEESMENFVDYHYSDNYNSPTELEVFETVFDMIPDEQLEKYVSMLSIDAYLSNYKYLQSRGIKMTAERGNEAVEAIPRMGRQDKIGFYFAAMDDLVELCDQGALKKSNFKVSSLFSRCGKNAAPAFIENLDTILRHYGDRNINTVVESFLMSGAIDSKMILRNAKELIKVSAKDYEYVLQLVAYSIGVLQNAECRELDDKEAEGLSELIKALDSIANEAKGEDNIENLVSLSEVQADTLAYNLEIFLDNDIYVDIKWLITRLWDKPLALLDNYETLIKHGATIDMEELVSSIRREECIRLETYDKIVALDPGAIDATTTLAEIINKESYFRGIEFVEWQKRGADLNKALAACDEITGVFVNPHISAALGVNSMPKDDMVIKLVSLGVDPNLLASKLTILDLLKYDVLAPLLRAGASVDFGPLLKAIESETYEGDTYGIDDWIKALAINMPDVAPLVKAIHSPAILEKYKPLLIDCGADL